MYQRILSILLSFLMSVALFFGLPTSLVKQTPPQEKPEYVKVARVIDGDTIITEDGRRVRYIGIDTPEISPPHCYAEEAKQKNTDLILGKTIVMKKDISETDTYGRLLRYVYVENPSITQPPLFINAYLIREGYARLETIPPDVLYSKEFDTLQKQAISEKKGLWKACLSH